MRRMIVRAMAEFLNQKADVAEVDACSLSIFAMGPRFGKA
jgi:hypothetical protein